LEQTKRSAETVNWSFWDMYDWTIMKLSDRRRASEFD